MENTIDFLPIVLYSLIGSILFYTKRISFNNQISILSVALVAHIVISIIFGSWIWTIGQILLSFIIFALLIIVFKGKTSGETMLTFSSLLALLPIPIGFIPFGITMILLFVVAAFSLRKQKGAFKTVILDATLSTGLSYSKPDYSHLPERASLDSTVKRTSLLPYIAIVMSLTALYYFVQPFFLES